MLYQGIDHLTLPALVLDGTTAPYARLGLQISPVRQDAEGWLERFLFVGGEANLFGIEFLSVADRRAAGAAPGGQRYLDALDAGRGAFAVALRVESMPEALRTLASRGLEAASRPVTDPDGNTIADFVLLPAQEAMTVPVALIQYPDLAEERYRDVAEVGLLSHRFPLKRLDHLAAVAPDLEGASRFWSDVLGVPVAGEVVSPTTVIRQFKIGDAILELLGPATPESPIRARPAGLISMAAFEVADLEASVEQARSAGFNVPNPATGALPRTRTATIPASELGGMALQLLEYV